MKKLVLKAQSGDKEAFVRLMEIHKSSMLKVARSFFSEPFDIEDVMQDTIMSCWANLPTLKQPEYFKTWLIRILINHCNAVLKNRPKTVSIDTVTEVGSEEYDPDQMNFDDIIEILDNKYRIVLTLYYNDGFTTSEISDILNIPTETVKTRLKRGREQLYQYLKGGDHQ